MAGSLSELWKKGSTAPITGDIPEGGLAIDVIGKKAYSADTSGAPFEIGGGAPIDHTHEIDDVNGLQTALDGKEPYLGVPTADGQVLASTIAGVRSWVTASGGGVTDHEELTSIGQNTHAQIDIHLADTANPHAVTAAQVGAAPLVHEHVVADITDFPSTMPPSAHDHNDIYYQKSEHINVTTGVTDAGKPIVLDANGRIDASMIEALTFIYIGEHTPAVATEYPDSTGYAFGSFWNVAGLDPDAYTFTTGDLVGRTVSNGDLLIWGESGWSANSNNFDPDLYYRLDGAVALTGPLAGGGQKLVNISAGTEGGDAVEFNQLGAALNGKADLAHTHAIADVTGLQTELDLKLEQADLDSALVIGAY